MMSEKKELEVSDFHQHWWLQQPLHPQNLIHGPDRDIHTIMTSLEMRYNENESIPAIIDP
ncbi:hypothetical protein PsorP6_000044 [Peronosclerospora sorghi]|uniref:Uncharacterized protein n=1 Tax=Peronosclerospora sorghi TaxID=230839 RepID=A0ACC0WPK4_9STRA|nr:hypothetical protein PsorP6_000044 [Peronosclerospora sorghi]